MIGRFFLLATSATVGALTMVAAAGSATPQRASDSAEDSARRCASLVGRDIGGGSVSKSVFVPGGGTLPPFKDPMQAAFCRVEAVANPVPGSTIRMQIWLPVEWNGKFVGVGGGGFEGGFASAPIGLRAPVSAGYAALATDAGHVPAADPSWAVGNFEKIVDYGHRANHVGAVFGKALVAEYYGTAAKRAYFEGCSNGGRDALMLAQRYPADYDAIVAGAPANAFTGVMTSFFRAGQMAGTSGIELTAAKLKLVHDAAVAKCDASDGLKDGLIASPQSCRFDPAVLQCGSGAGGECLSTAEVDVVNGLYKGVHTGTGRQVISGFPVGSEYNWTEWLTTPRALGVSMGQQFFRYFVHGNPAWDPATFVLETDNAAAVKRLAPVLDARDPNLRPFLRRGGRLLMYHGWDDAAIPASNSVQYFSAMRRASGTLAVKQARLFMLPGVSHCTGGNGASSVDYLAAIDRWSQTGEAPDRLIAAKPASVYRAMAALPTEALLTRPVCAWPKAAVYKGSGSSEDPAAYLCR